ncbi:cell envelope biogenesis protein TonB [Bacteroidia bacterium]|nr:cell envelope biogenesis protein TonB [Bacteroidia bacterium]
MTNDFDLNSQKWLSLVFEGKNKNYGAYVMREESSDRHVKALLIVILVGLLLIFLPKLIRSVVPEEAVVEQLVEVTMVDIKQDVPEENQIKAAENVPPPPLLKETIQFTPPVIVEDEKVTAENQMANQAELSQSTAAISVATVHGSDKGVDIADLNEHKVVVQEEKKVFDHVEVMPIFPGGEKEFYKWLNDNLQYPAIAQEQGIQGRVIVRFEVSPNGSIGNVEVMRSLDPSCDKEAVRVVKKMPKWIPGKQNGTSVTVRYTMPIVFKLQGA